MSDPARRVYSIWRFRIVVLLLTLVFLPIVIGSSLLIYQYLRFSVMVEQRLRGERGLVPSRVYTRPLVVRPGIVLAADGQVRILNALRYWTLWPVMRTPIPRSFSARQTRMRMVELRFGRLSISALNVIIYVICITGLLHIQQKSVDRPGLAEYFAGTCRRSARRTRQPSP